MSSDPKQDRAARLARAIRIKQAQAEQRKASLPPRPADAPARLSDMQRSLWLTHQLEPLSASYNLVSAFRAPSPLDPSRLERAFNEVVSRHRILRSTFEERSGAILQIVHRHEDLPLEAHQVDDGDVVATARREARKPFDLTRVPLVRMLYITDRSHSEGVLLLVLHHILADERSLETFWRELAAIYDGRSPAKGADIQFDDYVHWQTESSAFDTARAKRESELGFWRSQLDPLPEELDLPFAGSSAADGEARGRLLVKPSAMDLLDGARTLATATGATPFMVFAFAFRLLLARYSQGARVAFATPATTRSHPAAAEMIGYFLNPLVVCVDIDEQERVNTAVSRFSTSLRELLAHASLPFDSLAGALSPPRRPHRHPIFQAMFVHQQRPDPPRLGEVELQPVDIDLGESKFDLTLFVSEHRSGIDLAVEFRADRYQPIWIEQLLEHYQTLLRSLISSGDRPVANLELLSEAEKERIEGWQRPAPAPATAALLPQQILERARQHPEAPALACGDERWSYRELEVAGLRGAAALAAAGIGPGDRVGLFADRSPMTISGLLATLWAGAAYVPLDPEYPADRNRRVLEDADVGALLTTSQLAPLVPDSSRRVILIDPHDDPLPEPFDPPELEADAAAYLLYTSGSTGEPKGVVVSHANLLASNGARIEYYDPSPERFLLLPSIAFDSSVAGIFWTLATGGTLVVPTNEEVRDVGLLLRRIDASRVDSLLCVPSLYAAILRSAGGRLADLSMAIVAGESCPPELVREHFSQLPSVRLFNEYGPTEATVWASVHEITAADAERPVPIGRPIPGIEVRLLDRLGRQVPAGIPGQAWIGGPTVARGYWRRPEATAERFVESTDAEGIVERRYRTGDLMTWTADGRLLFSGREDDQIKLRGFRIEPGEIETALVSLPWIEEAAVVARPLAGRGTAGAATPVHLVAFACTSEGDVPQDWRDRLAERIPEHMLPRRLVVIADLPRLPNGKIDRESLRTMKVEAEATGGDEVSPTSDAERHLVALWQGLLGLTHVGVNDNFFELGGHSLLVIEMAHAIARDQGVELPAAEVFETPTIRQLARRIENKRPQDGAGFQHLFPIQTAGRKTPFIVAIPHVFTDLLASRFRGERPVYGLRGVGLRPEGNLGRWRSMQDLGEELVEEIVRRFPTDRYILAGYSFGASMAFEATRLLEERGLPVERLYLIAPMPLNFLHRGPLPLEIDGLQKPVEELTVPELRHLLARQYNPFRRRLYSRLWRNLAIVPWRHLHCLVGRARRRAGLPLTPRILHADVRIDRFRLHRNYRPRKIHTPTVLFNPQEPEVDIAATWRPCFGGPLTICSTPDPHLGDLAIAATKERILEQLEELDAT